MEISLKEVEATRNAYQKQLKLAESMDHLRSNPDFKLVFLEYLLRDLISDKLPELLDSQTEERAMRYITCAATIKEFMESLSTEAADTLRKGIRELDNLGDTDYE